MNADLTNTDQDNIPMRTQSNEADDQHLSDMSNENCEVHLPATTSEPAGQPHFMMSDSPPPYEQLEPSGIPPYITKSSMLSYPIYPIPVALQQQMAYHYQENPESGVYNSKACRFITFAIVSIFVLFIVGGGPWTLVFTIPALVLLILAAKPGPREARDKQKKYGFMLIALGGGLSALTCCPFWTAVAIGIIYAQIRN